MEKGRKGAGRKGGRKRRMKGKGRERRMKGRGGGREKGGMKIKRKKIQRITYSLQLLTSLISPEKM
jgi:hypothetical protein